MFLLLRSRTFRHPLQGPISRLWNLPNCRRATRRRASLRRFPRMYRSSFHQAPNDGQRATGRAAPHSHGSAAGIRSVRTSTHHFTACSLIRCSLLPCLAGTFLPETVAEAAQLERQPIGRSLFELCREAAVVFARHCGLQEYCTRNCAVCSWIVPSTRSSGAQHG
jgi:hypothetical protein